MKLSLATMAGVGILALIGLAFLANSFDPYQSPWNIKGLFVAMLGLLGASVVVVIILGIKQIRKQ
ncbi:MAG: hypothetical protein A3C88_02035 [Candidatus Yanofskybacteria bacterium RIFCSPHIGHO2_02_FULL_50_12]|uniref:Uncharacterized protein n=1 Tax=Candidatus Yanofskybacteria bacterium RIFCSPHIGHO2_02_FULL_50_12 TaxID=1802685 RepID=A0A1F8FW34_9BACT|nr:MAG: hypothetical protein A3C88_02035 [Candidatus Yanofskybacteria bacterium RIFCSPHIGHO2_02_FULL_50_12]